MKKIISFLTASTLLTSQAFATDASFNVTYNDIEKIVSVDASFDSETKLSVSISPHYNYTPSKLTPPAYFYFHNTDSDGVLDLDIAIDEEMGSGKYDVYIDAPGYSQFQSFIFVNPDDESTLSLIDSINSASDGDEIYELLSDSETAAKLGIDSESEEFATYGKTSCDYVYHMKKDDYTFHTFTDTYRLGTSVNMIIQDLKNSASYGKMREIIEENADIIGIDLEGDYAKIKEKYKVFSKLYKDRDKFDSVETVAKMFDDIVDEILDEESENPPVKKPSSNKGGGGGGGGTVIMPATVEDKPQNQVQEEPLPEILTYTDIENHFSKQSVEALSSKNIISGYPDKTFRPDENITRAEFTKIAASAFGIESKQSGLFADVASDAWYSGYVGALSDLDVLKGYDGYFNPDRFITRQDVACVIYRLLALNSTIPDISDSGFSDASDIASYAIDAVNVLKGANIVNGNNNMFYPEHDITRGEVAVMIARTIDFVNSK